MITLPRIFLRNMSQSTISKLLNNAEIAEKRLADLRNKVAEVKKTKLKEKISELTHKNAILSDKVEEAKSVLIRLEKLHGKMQYLIPGKMDAVSTATTGGAGEPAPVKTETQEPAPKKEKKEKEPKKAKVKTNTDSQSIDIVDVRKLDFRIGKIIDINKHPDADSLYVEKIDCGEENPRTVVSGLVNHVPIEEMRNRMVVVLCNLKPVKMRGVTSEAMVMCASSLEKVEVLIPPSKSAPGDLVTCDGYPREPEAQLNPKKKIFETCAPDLKTNNDKLACYKDSPLVVPGKGPVVAASLKGVAVK